MGTLNNPTPGAVLRAAGRRIDTRPLCAETLSHVIGEVAHYIRWMGRPDATPEQAPLRFLAAWWLDGLITIEEGKLIEEGRTLR